LNTLATAARFETTERLNRYPRLIRDGKITADAAILDTEIWDAIACCFESETPIKTMLISPRRHGVGWRDVDGAMARAIESRTLACTKAPDDAALSRRRQGVIKIANLVRGHARFFIEITDTLETQARPSAQAA
jgi:hypothetical protein